MRNRTIKLAVVIAAASLGCVYPQLSTSAGDQAQRRAQTNRRGTTAVKQTRRIDYSKFSHRVPQHGQQACDSCHKFPTGNWNKVRKADAAFPDVTDYPEHSSCLGCHRRQFFNGARPDICANCHTSPSPRDGSRHPFPNPKEIFDASKKGQMAIPDFGINFPHDKHIEIVEPGESKGEESDPKSCAACHKTYQPQGESDEEFVTKPPKGLTEAAFWLKKGTFKTSPVGHTTCFTCHSQEGGLTPAPADCNVCHKLSPPAQQVELTKARGDYDPPLAASMGIKDKTNLEKWGTRHTAKFRHEWLPHAGLSCTSCHAVATLNTLDRDTRVQVKSCGGGGTGCHIEATTEGVLNFEVERKKADPGFECTKCHTNNGKKQAPVSHINAVTNGKPK
jgi:Class III cytochrome C family